MLHASGAKHQQVGHVLLSIDLEIPLNRNDQRSKSSDRISKKTEQKSYLHRKGILITRGLSHSPWPTSNFTIKNHLFHPPQWSCSFYPCLTASKMPESCWLTVMYRTFLRMLSVNILISNFWGRSTDGKNKKADKLTINLNHVQIYCVDRSMYCNIFCCSWKKNYIHPYILCGSQLHTSCTFGLLGIWGSQTLTMENWLL